MTVLVTFLLLGHNTQYPQLKGGRFILDHGFSLWSASSKAETACWKGLVVESCSLRGDQEAESKQGELGQEMHPFSPHPGDRLFYQPTS